MILHNIIELLNQTGKQQKELTDYLGISNKTFTNWKAGLSSSYTKYLPQIAEFFGVSVDRIAGTENDETDAIRKEQLEKLHKLSDDDLQKAVGILIAAGVIK